MKGKMGIAVSNLEQIDKSLSEAKHWAELALDDISTGSFHEAFAKYRLSSRMFLRTFALFTRSEETKKNKVVVYDEPIYGLVSNTYITARRAYIWLARELGRGDISGAFKAHYLIMRCWSMLSFAYVFGNMGMKATDKMFPESAEDKRLFEEYSHSMNIELRIP